MATNPSEAVFLNVEAKVDSAAKIQSANGKPHNQFHWASEINATTRSINILRGLISLTTAQILQIMGEARVDLGVIDTNPIDFINALVEPIELGISKRYVTFTFEDVTYVYAFVGAPANNYGAGIENKKVAVEDLLKVWQSDVIESGTPSVSAMLKVTGNYAGGGAVVYAMHDGLAPYGITFGMTRVSEGVFKLWAQCDNGALLDNIVFVCVPQFNVDGVTPTIETKRVGDGANRTALMLYYRSPFSSALIDGFVNYEVEIKCFVNPEGV